MVKALRSHEVDNVNRALDKMFHDAEKLTTIVYEGLLKHNQVFLDEAGKIGTRLEREAKDLTQIVISGQVISEVLDSATILEVAGEIQKIRYSFEKMVGAISGKIYEGVLFSDRAVLELKDFFNAVNDGLRNAHDLVLTQNPVLVKHIVQNFEVFEEKGRKYAEEHQDRLIKGVCLPKSSLIYLVILDSLKDTLRYIQVIAKAFGEKKK